MSTLLKGNTATDFQPRFLGRAGRLERVVMVLVFMLLILARLPSVALHGRIWAEEGTYFMRNGIVLSWPQAIFHPVGGYLNIVSNLAGIIAARLVEPENARWVGVITGLVFQTLPAVLIVSSRWEWLQSRIGLIAALLIVATAPLAEEVWLNSLHPQFHLTLCAALILCTDPARGWTGRSHLFLLLLATLCGPTAWFVMPLFLARAVVDRSGSRAVQAAVLAAGVVVQAAFFYSADQTAAVPFNLSATASAFFCKHLLIPFLDFRTADAIGMGLRGMAAARTVPIVITVAEAGFAVLCAALLWTSGKKDLFWMFMTALVLAGLTYASARAGAVDMMVLGNGNRYAFVPQVLFALTLLGTAMTGKTTLVWFARGAVIWILLIGITEFHSDGIRSRFIAGPVWTDEVAAWRRDPNHMPRILPIPWVVDLNPPGAFPHS
jgi:hypothetical protein